MSLVRQHQQMIADKNGMRDTKTSGCPTHFSSLGFDAAELAIGEIFASVSAVKEPVFLHTGRVLAGHGIVIGPNLGVIPKDARLQLEMLQSEVW